jgi:hypothetical protein
VNTDTDGQRVDVGHAAGATARIKIQVQLEGRAELKIAVGLLVGEQTPSDSEWRLWSN